MNNTERSALAINHEATVKIEPIAITDEDGNPTSEYAYVTTKTFTEQEIKAKLNSFMHSKYIQ